MRANNDFLVGDGKKVRFWEDAWCCLYFLGASFWG